MEEKKDVASKFTPDYCPKCAIKLLSGYHEDYPMTTVACCPKCGYVSY